MPPKLGRSFGQQREGGWVRIDVLLGRTARVQASFQGEGSEMMSAGFEAYVNNRSSHSVCFICAYLAFKRVARASD
jgi:hypothetical protein